MEPKFRRVGALELLHIAFLGGQKSGQAVQEIDGSLAINGADVSLGLVGPDNLLAICPSQLLI